MPKQPKLPTGRPSLITRALGVAHAAFFLHVKHRNSELNVCRGAWL